GSGSSHGMAAAAPLRGPPPACAGSARLSSVSTRRIDLGTIPVPLLDRPGAAIISDEHKARIRVFTSSRSVPVGRQIRGYSRFVGRPEGTRLLLHHIVSRTECPEGAVAPSGRVV